MKLIIFFSKLYIVNYWLLGFKPCKLQEGHEEAQEELPKKAKYFFSTAVQNWNAEFYVKVDDNIDLDLGWASLF